VLPSPGGEDLYPSNEGPRQAGKICGARVHSLSLSRCRLVSFLEHWVKGCTGFPLDLLALSSVWFNRNHLQSRTLAYSGLLRVSVVDARTEVLAGHTSKKLVCEATIDLRSKRILHQFLLFCCQR
jgi:hypothetical protein